ncbi:hypothetical protein [Alcaligenes parafaecalis]|uniref:Uncharacterized protein n=1 Tax=Alcaligenes parafaecalis TaxID=171260 RepID=A0ABT3VKL0_9BURK|nr:hypothetical protein [Alcaligenes parafaecalis]MCX5464034.1 hypothetical protein [Alcaligenes parafaecalis]
MKLTAFDGQGVIAQLKTMFAAQSLYRLGDLPAMVHVEILHTPQNGVNSRDHNAKTATNQTALDLLIATAGTMWMKSSKNGARLDPQASPRFTATYHQRR